MNTQELGAKSYFNSALILSPAANRREARSAVSRAIRGISKGLLTGALLLASQSFAQAQAPVLRQSLNGQPVMQFNTVPNSIAEAQAEKGERFPLQPVPQTPELMQIGQPQQSAQQAFNIQSPQSQNVQLVAERRGFFDTLFPWRRRDNVPQEYEQPVEPPNQYQSNPLPPNSETDYGPAMSGFNQRYQRPTTPTHPGVAPPRTAQGGRPTMNPPTVRPPATPPAAPPQASGTTTTGDGRELPVFQFGTGPRSTGPTLTPPPAPRPQPSATPTTSTPSNSLGTPSVTPSTPMPLRSPSSILPPVSESTFPQQNDPPAFEDPIVAPESTQSEPLPLPSDAGASAFPPPPSGAGVPPMLSAPPVQQDTPPAFAPPGAPRIDAPGSSDESANAGPQLFATPPTFTGSAQSNASPFFVSNTEQEETEEDKFARIRERRGQTGLKGFCPVMLRDHRELVDASAEFQIEFNGKTYYVSSEEALNTFASDPAKYAPAMAGSDVIHHDLTGEELPGSLDHAVWYRGRLYMFATAETMETFVAAPAAHRTDI